MNGNVCYVCVRDLFGVFVKIAFVVVVVGLLGFKDTLGVCSKHIKKQTRIKIILRAFFTFITYQQFDLEGKSLGVCAGLLFFCY